MGQCIPLFEPGDRVTGVVTGAVIGGRYVDVTAARNADGSLNVGPVTAAGVKALAVAAYDQPAVGGWISLIAARGCILPVEAGAAITFGQLLDVDNVGRVVPHTTGVQVAKAVDTQATVGQPVMVQIV